MTELKMKKWDVVEQLKTDEDMALYLDACMEEDPGDGSLIRAALRHRATVRDERGSPARPATHGRLRRRRTEGARATP